MTACPQLSKRFWRPTIAAAIYSVSLAWLIVPGPAIADEAEVIAAIISCRQGNCSLSATVRHGDTGWDHYADHWRIVTPDGTEIGRRVLYHPHEQEQPFTRSLGRVAMPDDVEFVWIEAHDSVHGYGGKRFKLTVQAD